jgi:pSer/pThr/pTyr-binding forkhead associated (FHA) protein
MIESGGGRREIALSGIITIGRQNESSIYTDDPKTSRSHARLYHDGENWFLEDLESRSGTFLNGKKISSPQHLMQKDVFTIGDSHFYFLPDEAPLPSQNQGEGKWIRKQGSLQFPVKLQLYFILFAIGIISTFGFHFAFLWVFDNYL